MATMNFVENPVDPEAQMHVTDDIDMQWDEPLVTHGKWNSSIHI